MKSNVTVKRQTGCQVGCRAEEGVEPRARRPVAQRAVDIFSLPAFSANRTEANCDTMCTSLIAHSRALVAVMFARLARPVVVLAVAVLPGIASASTDSSHPEWSLDADTICPSRDSNDPAQKTIPEDLDQASSDSPAARKEALGRIVQAANADFEAGRFRASLVKSCEVYRRSAKTPLLYNIAQAQRSLGRCVEAKTAYEAYLERGENEYLLTFTRDYLRELSDCTSLAQSKPIPEVLPEHKTKTPEAKRRGATPVPVPKKGTAVDASLRADSNIPTATWALAGGALATVIVGTVLQVQAADHEAGAASGEFFDPSLEERAEWERNLSGVLFGAGAVFAASSVLWLWLAPDNDPSPPVAAALVPTQGGARARVKLTF